MPHLVSFLIDSEHVHKHARINVYAPHSTLFRSKTVIELGSGYGLAGLVVAMATEASEVVISDGNPQVVDCILFMLSCTALC